MSNKPATAVTDKFVRDQYRCYELLRDLHRESARKFGAEAAQWGLQFLIEDIKREAAK